MTYDVAIVGGGVIGWSAASHLLRREPRLSVVIIDPHPALQSSLRGTGGVRAQFGSEVNVRLSLAAIEEFKRFTPDTGHEIGFRQTGYLIFTAEPTCAEAMKAAVELQRSLGLPTRELGKREIRALAPYLKVSDLLYGAFCPTDGLLEGPEVVRGYRAHALSLGAKELRRAASGIGRGVVETPQGEVAAKEIVFCVGHWSSRILPNLPITPERHQLFTRPDAAGIPDDAPMVIDADTGFHFRRRGEGLLVGCADRGLAQSPCDYERAPHFDASMFFRMRMSVRSRCPAVFDGWTDIDGWSGYYAVTPDRHPLLGREGDLILATGFGGHGVMHSPAAGRIASELILDGASSIDISALLPSRFVGEKLSIEAMVF